MRFFTGEGIAYVLSTIGSRMLFSTPEAAASAAAVPPPRRDIAFTPLAMPSLDGPGSIAVGIAVTAAICYLVLRSSTRLARFLGPSGVSAMTGIMGFLLVCIGVQFVINGVLQLLGGSSP